MPSNEAKRPDPTTSVEAAERVAEAARIVGAEATVKGNIVSVRWDDGPLLNVTVTLVGPVLKVEADIAFR